MIDEKEINSKADLIDWNKEGESILWYRNRINILKDTMRYDAKIKKISDFEIEMAKTDFWNDQNNAKSIMSQLNDFKSQCADWNKLYIQVNELLELYKLASADGDYSLYKDIESEIEKLAVLLFPLELKTKLGGKYDKNDAIITIHAGAGGTEACDWVAMLMRMYSRWAEKQNYTVDIIYSADGEETGFKNITMIIKGKAAGAPHYIYGLLNSEIGVHRLVRISPFDTNKRRHTTFAAVDILPELEDDIEISIEEKDIRIDTYRSSGAGGQHVNTTDSAVRITHIPTGIIAQSQNDRSQIKNRAIALKLLKARLHELEIEKQRATYEKHYNEKGSIEWGNQIRSYVFMPYQMVKDHRTGYETSQITDIMDGDINKCISHYLTWKSKNKK
ncbi:MAG: peptide chain release factor 2 [Elusimicrobiota bacterium]|jgi:peptide chain release factor 2|nr:peptide chain release factor 2 [Elusimicrobiota bacterium]